MHQKSLNEPDTSNFKSETEWERFDGIVICGFYYSWNLRELIRSGRPVICANFGYADDLGLGERLQEHIQAGNFNGINNTHPIVTGAGLTPGNINVGSPVWTNSISIQNHHVDVLLTTMSNQAVLVAHKTHPLVYFGCYRMSRASPGSKLYDLLVSTANWAFSGP